MMKKQKQRSENGARKTDRTSIILSMFREFPNNKFSLKHLASASGGATKEGRRETLEILGRLFEEGVVEECAREKYRLMQTHLPHYEGVADMAPSGSVYVKVEGQESDIFVNQRNAANALNGDRVEVVVMHRGRDGKMYFGGVDGFNRFDPDNIRMRSYAPPVLINSFSVRQRPLSDFRADREIVLSHGENFFSIQFSALEYIRNESCEYAYILRGFDDDWVYAGTDNTAVFTNVPPGSYEFSVRATNGGPGSSAK